MSKIAKMVNTILVREKNHYIGKVNYLCEIHYILNKNHSTNGRKPTAREASKGGQSKG